MGEKSPIRLKTEELFSWFGSHLTASSTQLEERIEEFYAPEFVVVANGVLHNANKDNYLEFLNEFRSTIKSISYQFNKWIEEKNAIVICMNTQIVRLDLSTDLFDSIKVLEFDEENKITLWHEVYTVTKEA